MLLKMFFKSYPLLYSLCSYKHMQIRIKRKTWHIDLNLNGSYLAYYCHCSSYFKASNLVVLFQILLLSK